jgi:hypothetical protein
VHPDREEAAIGAAEAMAEATSRLRSRGWMISSVTQPLIPAEAAMIDEQAPGADADTPT